ncbi:glutaredoxin 3 [Candidatus Woesearchaeota archaeon CG11_big_fil_rev_8_21_14_0_20_43_8]|nr:MAG: glutaredoxin 3 [Candidatus Woesearchaeota archaeon CG11_big_fil_rev_8_21_14_0_20_43_8]PIO04814.1 MAG: glutaredoxin 3 [Candidatus Woesearchaeota archaeon CG08_land_8_20_14_0_20_43_7]
MANIEIYTKKICPYCIKAKNLLESKEQGFIEYKIDEKPELRDEMIKRSGRMTVPQIFINGKHIGGCDDLYSLESNGELDKLFR